MLKHTAAPGQTGGYLCPIKKVILSTDFKARRDNDKDSIICLKLFANTQELNKMIDYMPDEDKLVDKITRKPECSDDSHYWTKFDRRLRQHVRKLYEKLNIDRNLINESCLLMITHLYILERLHTLIIRVDYMAHITSAAYQLNQYVYNLDSQNLLSPQHRKIYHMIQLLFSYYGKSIANWSSGNETLKHFEWVCNMTTNWFDFYFNDNYFLSKFCNNYNIIHTAYAKLKVMNYKIENDKLISKPMINVLSETSKYSIAKGYQLWIDPFDLFSDEKYGYSLKKTEYLATLWICELLYDNIINGMFIFSRNVLRVLRATIYLLNKHISIKCATYDLFLGSQCGYGNPFGQIEDDAFHSYLLSTISLTNLDFSDVYNHDNGNTFKFEKVLKNIVMPGYEKFGQRMFEANLGVFNPSCDMGNELWFYMYSFHACILLGDWREHREYCKKWDKWKQERSIWNREYVGLLPHSPFTMAIENLSKENQRMFKVKNRTDKQFMQLKSRIEYFQRWKNNMFNDRFKPENINSLNIFFDNVFNRDFHCEKFVAWRNIATMKECNVCYRKTKVLRKCKKCKNVLYCSKQCQKVDWCLNNHKLVCK